MAFTVPWSYGPSWSWVMVLGSGSWVQVFVCLRRCQGWQQAVVFQVLADEGSPWRWGKDALVLSHNHLGLQVRAWLWTRGPGCRWPASMAIPVEGPESLHEWVLRAAPLANWAKFGPGHDPYKPEDRLLRRFSMVPCQQHFSVEVFHHDEVSQLIIIIIIKIIIL